MYLVFRALNTVIFELKFLKNIDWFIAHCAWEHEFTHQNVGQSTTKFEFPFLSELFNVGVIQKLYKEGAI